MLMLGVTGLQAGEPAPTDVARANVSLFERSNLVAWCIVPFDDRERTPLERAEMLNRLGLHRLAYDYRAQHIPTFDAELSALQAHQIELTAWWFPGELNAEARLILDVLKRHNAKTQLWVSGGGEPVNTPAEQTARVTSEANRIRPIALAAAEIGCKVGLYNHGGWFGEPDNQLAIIHELGLPNVGIVYNQHHGHAHVGSFRELLQRMEPHLYVLNLNGMVPDGDQQGQKIVPLGAGELDLELLKIIAESDYRGPIGILNHTQENAEQRLQDNLDGLAWLTAQLKGAPAGPCPTYRTWQVPPAPAVSNQDVPPTVPVSTLLPATSPEYDPALVAKLVQLARTQGDPRLGQRVFTSARSACASCHRVGNAGGVIGPELTTIARKQTDEQLVESVWWPKRLVTPGYVAHALLMADGLVQQGYLQSTTTDAEHVQLKVPATGELLELATADIEEQQEIGTLMPDGLLATMNAEQQLDLLAFLFSLRDLTPAQQAEFALLAARVHSHTPAPFEYRAAPLLPAHWPRSGEPVNRDRIYDFYAKQAEHFRTSSVHTDLLAPFPGLDGGTQGHWGNQNEAVWSDGRWNETDLGSMQSGVFERATGPVARSVCVRLGGSKPLAVCYDQTTLSYVAVWRPEANRYLQFSHVRHGFMQGVTPVGSPVSAAQTAPAAELAGHTGAVTKYQGLYRHGRSVIFACQIAGVDYLDSATVNSNGKFERLLAPRKTHPLKSLLTGGPRQSDWSWTAAGTIGTQHPFAVDTIPLPVQNPWKALLFCSAHALLPDGTAYVATMQGDVWKVTGLDDSLQQVTWNRFASGLHHPLGMLARADGLVVMCRDQLLRLHDLNADGEADYYECVSQAFETSPAGHDYICGLSDDAQGRFYMASGNQGLVRLTPAGTSTEVLATGFRNPDGLGVLPDGAVTVPCSEGDWTPASMICLIRPPADTASSAIPHFGYGGPRHGEPPALPLLYLPRGFDNSAGGQVPITDTAWPRFQQPGLTSMVHLSFGAGTAGLLLQSEVRGQRQGAIMPLQTEFHAGAHRGQFSPHDGHLYVSGMAGWGSYTPDDGCFQRVRLTAAESDPLPTSVHVHENGIRIDFSAPLDENVASQTQQHFAQCWNYRYSSHYGSPELAPSHPGTAGHDVLAISDSQVLMGGRTLFLELPDLQPVNQLHLWLGIKPDRKCELFLTVHALDAPFTDLPGYRPRQKTIATHPLLTDLTLTQQSVPNPWLAKLDQARPIEVRTGSNLTYATRSLSARRGEPLALTLKNPDVVPHNWALVTPGSLRSVGEASNRLIAAPDAALRQYVPDLPEVLAYTDVVPAGGELTIHFRAPEQAGRYPFLCTFPGHWMVMNGELIVTD